MKNHVTGYSYDAAGNMTSIPSVASYTYNAEGQLVSTAGVTYTYDGEGRRVQKSSGKLYWYGTGSTPLDESDASGNITNEYVFFGGARIARRDSSGNVNYYFADRLGTARVVTNSSGSVLDDSDFYPFGGERVISSSSGNTYKFESKERDAESGNDDFGARFYASRYGRFLSVDWSAVPAPVPYANLTNPQTLNLFSFVADNPETFADLDGHQLAGPWNHPWEAFGEPVQPYPRISDLQLPGGEAPAWEEATVATEVSEAQTAQRNQAPAQQPPQEPLISGSVEGGAGFEYKAKLGEGIGKIGAAIKGELEVSPNGTKVSAKAEIGGTIGPIKLGGVQAEWVTKNEQGKSERPTLTWTKPGIAHGKAEATGGGDKVTIAVSAYDGPGAGVSVTVRPLAIIVRVAITAVVEVARYAADQAF